MQVLLLDGRRCTGVRYSVAADVREACASREVVVSAGTIRNLIRRPLTQTLHLIT